MLHIRSGRPWNRRFICQPWRSLFDKQRKPIVYPLSYLNMKAQSWQSACITNFFGCVYAWWLEPWMFCQSTKCVARTLSKSYCTDLISMASGWANLQLFTTRQICKKSHEKRIERYQPFVNYNAAFNTRAYSMPLCRNIDFIFVKN